MRRYKPFQARDGKWYISTGRTFFRRRSFDTESECLEFCIIQRMFDAEMELNKACEELAKRFPEKYDMNSSVDCKHPRQWLA